MNTGLYQQASFRQAAGCEFRPGGLDLTRKMAAACALRPGDRVLDLGCGVGSTASYLSRGCGARVTGLDSSPGFLDEARLADPGVEWVLGRADALPFEDDLFDAVFAECFLSAFEDSGAILAEIRRVLRPGGRLAVSDMYLREPSAGSLERVASPATCLTGARGAEATLADIRLAGLTVIMWEDRSEALKVMMASLIMAYGSTDAFWEAVCGCGEGGCGERAAAARAAAVSATRPGYFILVAGAQYD